MCEIAGAHDNRVKQHTNGNEEGLDPPAGVEQQAETGYNQYNRGYILRGYMEEDPYRFGRDFDGS